MIFQESLGVDIQEDRVALVFLRKGLRKIEVAGKALFRLDPALDVQGRLTATCGFLDEFRKENRLGAAEVYVGLPPDLIMNRVVVLPAAVRENLAGTLRYEMEKLVPIPAEGVRFDFQLFSEEKETGQIRVLLSVAKKPALDPFLELADRVPGGLSGLEPASVGYINAVSADAAKPGQFKNDPAAAVDFLMGNVQPDTAASDPSIFGLPAREYGAALGLALQGLQDCPLQLNLLPPAFRRRPSRLGVYVAVGLLSLSLLAGMAWGGAVFYRQRTAAQQLDAELRRLSEEVLRVQKLEKNIENLRDQLQFLRGFQEENPPTIEILREMTQIIPETAWVREFSFSGNKIQIHGEADSASRLIGLLESSPLFQNVVFRSAIVRDGKGKERFNIEMELEGSAS